MSHDSASASHNPYRSPVGDLAETPSLADAGAGEELTDRQVSLLRRHVLICFIPFFVLAGFIAVSGVIAMSFGESNLLILIAEWGLPTWLRVVLITPVALLFPVGISLASQTVNGHRFLVWAGSILFFLGGSGSVGVLGRISSGQGLFGLAQLFGASCYATLLTGFALFAIILRDVAKRCRLQLVARCFELTIPGLGVAAGTVSVLVMFPRLDETLRSYLNVASYVIVLAVSMYAVSLMMLSHGIKQLCRTRRAKEHRLSPRSRND